MMLFKRKKTIAPKTLLFIGAGVLIVLLSFHIWKAIPRTITQIFPESQQADSCQIIASSLLDFSDVRLEGEMFYSFLKYLDKLKFYPAHRKMNPYGAEVLEGNVCYHVTFYKDGYLGQIIITDTGTVSYASRHYEIRDEEAVSGWNALMRTYIEQYSES